MPDTGSIPTAAAITMKRRQSLRASARLSSSARMGDKHVVSSPVERSEMGEDGRAGREPRRDRGGRDADSRGLPLPPPLRGGPPPPRFARGRKVVPYRKLASMLPP